MMTTSGADADSYNGTAVVLHWLIFLFVVGLFVSGQIAEGMPQADRAFVMNWHKAIGVIAFALALFRIVWRLVRGAPAPVEMSRPLTILAHATHGLLYVLLLVMPASGFMMSMAAGRGVPLLGIPPLMERTPELAKKFSFVHGTSMKLILALVLLHAVAALWHHYVQKDTTLARMVPWLRQEA